MSDKNLTTNTNNLCYRIAHNMLADNDDITSCMDMAKRAATSSKHDYSSLLEARVARNYAFKKFVTASIAEGDNTSFINVTSIIEELSKVATSTCDNSAENVILLQLSDILDKYIRTLTLKQQTVYIRRYFFADPIEDIAKVSGTSEDNIKATLQKCNEGLFKLLADKGYIVKKETIFQCLTDIGDDLIDIDNNIDISSDTLVHGRVNKINDSEGNNSENKLNTSKTRVAISKYIPAIATVIAILFIAVCLIFIFGKDESGAPDLSDMDTRFLHIFDTDSSNDNFVIINELKKYEQENLGLQTHINIASGIFRFQYTPLKLMDSGMLPYCIGKEITSFASEGRSFYTLLGHDAIQYLIVKENDDYSLYVQDHANPIDESERYAFSTLLEEIYDIDDASDISLITSCRLDNLKYTYIDDSHQIDAIFSMLLNMNSTTSNIWTDIANSTSGAKVFSENSVLLIFTTTDGEEFQLCYQFEKQYFYESGGRIYNKVTDEAHATLNNLLALPEPQPDPVIAYKPDDSSTWNLELSIGGVTSTYLSLGFTHQASKHTVDLYTDDLYILEKFENDTWSEVTHSIETELTGTYNPLKTKIPKNSEVWRAIFFTDKYEELTPGLYRISVTVRNTDTDGSSEYIEATFSKEFSYGLDSE